MIETRAVSNWNRFLPLTVPESVIAAPKRVCYVINYKFVFFHFRCSKDETVRFHGGPSTTQRFSFEAFQFLNGQVEPYLYVHCEVVLCNLTDAEPSCRKDCSDPLVDSRQKRAVNTDIYDLEKGPIVLLRDSEYSLEDKPENEDEAGQNQGKRETYWNSVLFNNFLSFISLSSMRSLDATSHFFCSCVCSFRLCGEANFK